jgi:uncharacterized phage-associated protein
VGVGGLYEARKIANFLLQEFDAHAFDVSNMKINKILYFIQGWGYVLLDRKLIRNHFVAWEYGPVVRSVYDSFKEFEHRPITKPACYLNYETGNLEAVSFKDVDEHCVRLIRKIAPYYIAKSTSELVAMSHSAGGPWDTARKARLGEQHIFQRIPDEHISIYFKKEFGASNRN